MPQDAILMAVPQQADGALSDTKNHREVTPPTLLEMGIYRHRSANRVRTLKELFL
jgi:hypothetical protein